MNAKFKQKKMKEISVELRFSSEPSTIGIILIMQKKRKPQKKLARVGITFYVYALYLWYFH